MKFQYKPGDMKLLEVRPPVPNQFQENFAKIIERHFPKYRTPQELLGFAGLLHSKPGGWFAIDKQEELRRLRVIKKSAETLWNEYNQLCSISKSSLNCASADFDTDGIAPVDYLLHRALLRESHGGFTV